MRKCLIWIIALLLLLCASASADTAYSFDDVSANLSLADSYIVLTADNLSAHTELLGKIGKSKEVVEADFAERGVLLQAWVPELDACLEITAVQDEDSQAYFDLDQQTSQTRSTYRASVLKGQKYKDQGYSIKEAEWKKQTLGGRFLMIKYKRTLGDQVYWGYARRAIRNGYTFTLDYQVYNRGLRAKDLNAVNKVANTVSFTLTQTAPVSATGLVQFTAEPPEETNTGEFTVEGKCTPGAHLIGVVMRWSSSEVVRVEATAKKSGSFKLPVTLPGEGVWLMTLTVENDGVVIAEEVFDVTTFNKSLLPVALDQPLPEQLTGDELVISGKTVKAVSVQCLVSNSAGESYEKMIRTNNSGKFSFKVPSSTEADYQITLVFSKKNYSTRRFTQSARRTLTEADIRSKQREQAIKPAYSNLVKKLDAYTGRIMVYSVYITDIQQSGEEWIIFAAMKKNKAGYSNPLVIVSEEEPTFAVGTQQTMLGTCTGSYRIESEEDVEFYPSFDLLFWDGN